MSFTYVCQVLYKFFLYIFEIFMQNPIGERLRETRKVINLSQKELAEAIKVTQSAISLAERDGSISNELAEYIRKTHNINLNWLFTGEGEMISGNIDTAEISKLKEEKRALERSLLSLNEQLTYYLKKELGEDENKEVGT